MNANKPAQQQLPMFSSTRKGDQRPRRFLIGRISRISFSLSLQAERVMILQQKMEITCVRTKSSSVGLLLEYIFINTISLFVSDPIYSLASLSMTTLYSYSWPHTKSPINTSITIKTSPKSLSSIHILIIIAAKSFKPEKPFSVFNWALNRISK